MQASGGDIGGGNEAETLEVDDDTLLTGCSGYSTLDSLELAGDDTDNVTAFIMDMLGFYHSYIVAVGGQCPHEIVHGNIGDDKRRIITVCPQMKVVVVVGNDRPNVWFLQDGVKDGGFGLGKY